MSFARLFNRIPHLSLKQQARHSSFYTMPLKRHPLVADGWFREINPQWPGQAMTLKVEEILHTEKSLYQDVLVFRSATYGNVLVLDGVIQCTERDEFSYQEMIAHLPMASHPNPKNVLVIGGGDGGVIREVLKHETVEHVTLCDIDEAVVRVSKEYLPHMSAVFKDPKVTVFIGDGFKFLPKHENEYDVIITDSSDPVGPAAALFEAPYFTLLKKALREGGHMSTQGESIWLHLPLIKELRETTKRLFPVAEYAYTTIPTYPSGSIGFVCCSLDANRSISTPLREVPNCKYYNKDVHRAAFVLPEFGRAMIEEGKIIQEDFSGVRPGQVAGEEGKGKKVLLLGSGFVAGPAVEYISAKGYELTVGCRTVEHAEQLTTIFPGAVSITVDVDDTASLDAAIADTDLVVSLIPYTYHTAVIESAIRNKKHVVTTSYVSPAMKALEQKCKDAGIIVMNEMGLDPGIDHVGAVRIIDQVHREGGKVKSFISMCGGLPDTAAANNPLGYKFSWSARGVLLALRNTGKFYRDGKVVTVEGKDLMSEAKPYPVANPAYNFICYPNRDSTPFKEFYNIPEVETLQRGTLRYTGFDDMIKCFIECGFLDDTPKDWLKSGSNLTWVEVTSKALGCEANESAIIEKLKSFESFAAPHTKLLLGKFKKLGLFSSEPAEARENLLDTLCARLENLMQYETGEQDLVYLQHTFIVERKDGKIETITSVLDERGSPTGWSAMARLVGIPCGIAVDLVLNGTIKTPGVLAPYDIDLCNAIEKEFAKVNIKMVEEVL